MTSAVQNPTYTTSVITSSTLTSSSVSSTSPVTTCSSYDQSSVHTRIAYQSPASPADAAPGSVAVSDSLGFLFLGCPPSMSVYSWANYALNFSSSIEGCVGVCVSVHCVHVGARGQLTGVTFLFCVSQVSHSGRLSCLAAGACVCRACLLAQYSTLGSNLMAHRAIY